MLATQILLSNAKNLGFRAKPPFVFGAAGLAG
jgi:hypothetical protein